MPLSHEMTETIFSKIIQKKLPAEILYQDEEICVFKDKFPLSAVHFLVVSVKIIPSLNETTKEDELLLGKMLHVAAEQAKKLNLDRSGYRVIINTGKDGGQEIMHLHLHVLGGEKIGPMRDVKLVGLTGFEPATPATP